ncbi:hypothetical protein XM38_036690 [Halomicronema hongdechloris C2206]|uniref:Uncharacterized protein n=1 Tax=Halomicronema hongdechloris C2206 TaxID=1641165 RepID=A0A1Z3HQX6_9CYAN|nr:hypothetical protein [Halomicronema hongdechloris]ASC72711.1 hypothetical protein XM38_036690 [Halomicronema hongdechloris C2206]
MPGAPRFTHQHWLLRCHRLLLTGLFGAALTASLLLGSADFVASQTEYLGIPETLQTAIEERAVNHANAGKQVYHDSIYEEFKDNSLGWDRSESLRLPRRQVLSLGLQNWDAL